MVIPVFFIGAGASVPFGIPTMTGLVNSLEPVVMAAEDGTTRVYQKIKEMLTHGLNFDIEALVTVLEAIMNLPASLSPVLTQPTYYLTAAGSLQAIQDRLASEWQPYETDARQLLSTVKDHIIRQCTIQTRAYHVYDALFKRVLFGRKINQMDSDQVISSLRAAFIPIFTTNYDQVLESYCEDREIMYYCGEQPQHHILNLRNDDGLFNRAAGVRIFKLHGSVNWYYDGQSRMRYMEAAALPGTTSFRGSTVDRELIIYPVGQKYTFREPFYTLFHHLKKCFIDGDVTCIVIGYSFSDDDILGLFIDSMRINGQMQIQLVDPEADVIKNRGFPTELHARIEAINAEFCESTLPEPS